MRTGLRLRTTVLDLTIVLACLLGGLVQVLPVRAAAQQRDAETLALDSLLDIKISTAAKYAQRIGEVASSVTIITSEEIERFGYRSLEDVLASVPGFYTSNDRNYTYIGARGFSRPTDYNNRLLVLVDGNTLNETIWGTAFFGNELAIPLRGLERIEIVRGPGSALYGTGAIFGVVNLITKSPATLDGGEIAAEGGSYGRRGGHLLFGREFADGVGVSLIGLWDRSDGQDLFYPEYDTPQTHDGVAHNLDWERRWGVLGTLTHGGFRVHGRYSTRAKAIPTAAYQMSFNAQGAETSDAFAFLELNYDRQLNAEARIATRSYYNGYYYTGVYPLPGLVAGSIDSSSESGRDDAVGGEVALRWDITSANRLTVGGEVKRHLRARYFERPAPNEAFDADFDVPSTVVSAYVQDEHQLLRTFAVLGGARYDRYSSTLAALTPRVGLVFVPVKTSTFKLLYGEAYRAPSVYEADIQSSQYRRNPDLNPERARTLELVWQQHLATGVLGTVSLFQYRMRGLIDLTADSVTSTYEYENVGSARSRGLEAGVESHLGGSISGYANYTYQRTLDEHDERLTNSPAHLLKAGAALEATSWLQPALQLRHESSRRTVYGTFTAAYTVADLNLILTPWFGPKAASRERRDHERLELTVRLNNLFNTSYATPGGVEHRQPAIRQDGRNVAAEVRYRF